MAVNESLIGLELVGDSSHDHVQSGTAQQGFGSVAGFASSTSLDWTRTTGLLGGR
jgi:hypothetical protein